MLQLLRLSPQQLASMHMTSQPCTAHLLRRKRQALLPPWLRPAAAALAALPTAAPAAAAEAAAARKASLLRCDAVGWAAAGDRLLLLLQLQHCWAPPASVSMHVVSGMNAVKGAHRLD